MENVDIIKQEDFLKKVANPSKYLFDKINEKLNKKLEKKELLPQYSNEANQYYIQIIIKGFFKDKTINEVTSKYISNEFNGFDKWHSYKTYVQGNKLYIRFYFSHTYDIENN